jgi:hypothetical protein
VQDNDNNIPLQLTNFPALRNQCLLRHWSQPDVGFSREEYDDISLRWRQWARVHRADEGTNEGLGIMQRDLDSLATDVPKWATLAAWLAPESAVGHAPSLVEDITRRALSGSLGTNKGSSRPS